MMGIQVKSSHTESAIHSGRVGVTLIADYSRLDNYNVVAAHLVVAN